MRVRSPVILSSCILFLLAFLPASLGAMSFYRYETVSLLLWTHELLPDFSFDSLFNIWRTNLYGYYRPGGNILWLISNLVAGKSPFILQIMQATVYALISVSLYLAGRFFSGEFAGWVAALIFAYLEPLVVLSWWTGTLDGFFGMLCYIIGLNLFLYTPFRSVITILLSCIFLGLGIFTKEIFIPLSAFIPLLVITVPRLKTVLHQNIMAITILLCGLKLILDYNMGASMGNHIIRSATEFDFTIAVQNYIDYGRLYLYGHNILLIGLCLFRPNKDEFKTPGRLTGVLIALLTVYLVSRILSVFWLIDIFMVLAVIYFFIRAQNHERIWVLWVLGGLSLVMLYNIPVAGGIMNRRLMEPSIGFALFTGCALAVYPVYFRHRLATFSWTSSISASQWVAMIRQRMDIVCIVLLLTVGFRQEIVTSGFMREWRYWIAEGEVLKTTLYSLSETLPADTHLLVGALPGTQHPHQIHDHLAFLFDRRDVKVFDLKMNFSEPQPRQTSHYGPIYILTKSSIPTRFTILYTPVLVKTFSDPDNLVKSVYLYQLQNKD